MRYLPAEIIRIAAVITVLFLTGILAGASTGKITGDWAGTLSFSGA